jgi:hypothetical protein
LLSVNMFGGPILYGLEEAAAQWRALARHEQSEYTTRAAALRESRCGDVGRVS